MTNDGAELSVTRFRQIVTDGIKGATVVREWVSYRRFLEYRSLQMSMAIEGLLFGWKKNSDYGPKLVADLAEEQMVAQPAPKDAAPMNHPAWVFSHLNAYLPVIEAIIEGREFDDPRKHPFGMLSKPEADASIYRPREELVHEFESRHERVTSLLSQATEAILDQPILLPRWTQVMPKAGIALPYLMLNHENLHLGQLSAWRRARGCPVYE